jgi:hypothetical protein
VRRIPGLATAEQVQLRAGFTAEEREKDESKTSISPQRAQSLKSIFEFFLLCALCALCGEMLSEL